MNLILNLCNKNKFNLFICINSNFFDYNLFNLLRRYNFMKNFLFKHKKIICTISILILLFISIYSISFGTESYEKPDFEYAKVTASHLNIRRGPGIHFQAVGLLEKGEYIRVFAKLGNWYVIQAENDIIGTVYADYIEPYTDYTEEPLQEENDNSSNASDLQSQTSNSVSNTETISTNSDTAENNNETQYTSALDTPLVNYTADEQEFINLINQEREKNNLPILEIDEDLQNAARLKAEDLVKNNYFSHTSPTYGTLYEMLDNNGIKYKIASENIAGNSSISGAITALMNSESHKNNILSNEFNYTGVGVVSSPTYGKILVQLFIGK